MIVYHSSTVRIREFYIPYGGLHVGGLYSSYEAALRKLRSDKNTTDADTVYVHKCEVDLGLCTEVTDAGGDESWRFVIRECNVLGFDSVRYKNIFEPDLTDSYMIWDASRIKILECDPIHMDNAEEILNEFYESCPA